MIEQYLFELIDYVRRTDHQYQDIFEKGLITHPIPFFGNVKTAKILTVGVNPSSGEFKELGRWPKEISCSDLKNRSLNYFSLESFPPHSWFNDWEDSLRILNCSYIAGEAAHLDLSPRATIPMGQVPNQAKFLDMIRNDVEWFFKILPLCGNAKLLMMAGSVTGKYYLVELLMELAGENGFELLFRFNREQGEGGTSFHKLKSGSMNLPIFFCSVSPSAFNSKLLIQRVIEKKEKLLSYLV